VGLADAVGKARAHQVMRRIRAGLDSAGVPSPARPLEVGFTNARPLLAGFWRAVDEVLVGWQMQGRYWRLAMVLTAAGMKGVGLHPERAEYAGRHEDYFDFTKMTPVLGVPEASLRPKSTSALVGGFNRYDPDFVYRYRRLPEAITAAEVVDLAVAYSEWASSWRPLGT
jgi:hypothetical protein